MKGPKDYIMQFRGSWKTKSLAAIANDLNSKKCPPYSKGKWKWTVKRIWEVIKDNQEEGEQRCLME